MNPMTLDGLMSFYETFVMGPLVVAIMVFGLLKAKTAKRYGICGVVIVVLLLPLLERELGTIYFNHLCKTEAGEFIYKTVDNVEGIFQMRPRDGSKDYIDRLSHGDYPEDPYGHTDWEAMHPEDLFVDPPFRSYKFFEQPILPNANSPIAGARFHIYSGKNQATQARMKHEYVSELRSKYGYTWHGINWPARMLFKIYGGETMVIDLANNEILATKRGFINFRTNGICPSDKEGQFMYKFVSKVLIPPTPKNEN